MGQDQFFTDGLRDISSDRRLAILAVCALEWRAAIIDAIVENNDRIVGKVWRDAKRQCDTQIDDAKASLQDTLRSFKRLGVALLKAKGQMRLLIQQLLPRAGGLISRVWSRRRHNWGIPCQQSLWPM